MTEKHLVLLVGFIECPARECTPRIHAALSEAYWQSTHPKSVKADIRTVWLKTSNVVSEING